MIVLYTSIGKHYTSVTSCYPALMFLAPMAVSDRSALPSGALYGSAESLELVSNARDVTARDLALISGKQYGTS